MDSHKEAHSRLVCYPTLIKIRRKVGFVGLTNSPRMSHKLIADKSRTYGRAVMMYQIVPNLLASAVENASQYCVDQSQPCH